MKSLDCDNFFEKFVNQADDNASEYHVPVMGQQVLAFLQPAKGGLFLDGTLGGGGHTNMLLRAGAHVIALDQDPDALAESGRRLKEFGSRVHLVESNFAQVDEALVRLGESRQLQGALLDLGVSSHQLDEAARGFSFMKEGPLDMRMSPSAQQTAADVVNALPASELERIFKAYGEEPEARRIAAHLAKVRGQHPFETTLQLANAVCDVVPRRGPRHPATRIFQALRIHVNDELGVLRRALQVIPAHLASGGRFAVISFHSLEDRIVKVFFREHSREWIDRPEWPAPRRNPERIFRILTPHPITASEAEMQQNPRSRSAKLRVVEKL
jgi:16S rRNA (cytosine1402-N4)-methyltransferase